MAILRLELEIDSDVYPELYARLASIGRQGARQEKLRQLAATGLVWELVRMHGPALADLGQRGPAAQGQAAALPDVDLPLDAAPAGSVRSGWADLDDLHDLGELGELDDLGDLSDLPEVPLNLPVLLDAVDEDGPLPPPQDLPTVTMATVVALRGDVEQPQVLDSGAEEPPPVPMSPRSGRSSRLKRMKDRGLFQNG